jgi:2-polyprenyl-3-methyl-5-hydroxy-6-metoxy-1,4-benzoquinol methylase
MAANENIQEALDKIIKDVMDVKSLLRGSSPTIESKTSTIQKTTPVVVAPVAVEDQLDTFEKLKEALQSAKWPEAVNKNLVCDPDSEQDKLERGRGIVELMIEEDLKDLKFLDAGCGEGHCAFTAQEFGPTISVGYDMRTSPSWEKLLVGKENQKVLFTDQYDKVKENGPYDVILAFDVVDHLENEDPVTFLKKLKDVLSDKGKIYLRLHPWTGRHATHLYHDLNKAFLHLVFTEEELRKIIPYSKYETPQIKVTTPIKTYEEFMRESGLKIVHRRDIQEKLEPFFQIPKIAERIMKATKFTTLPEWQLSLSFLDVVVAKA